MTAIFLDRPQRVLDLVDAPAEGRLHHPGVAADQARAALVRPRSMPAKSGSTDSSLVGGGDQSRLVGGGRQVSSLLRVALPLVRLRDRRRAEMMHFVAAIARRDMLAPSHGRRRLRDYLAEHA